MKNLRKVEETHVEYKGSKIHAFRYEWEEENDKGKEVTKKEVVCYLYRLGGKNQPLNLGEMSDGSKFSAVAQSVNEAKRLVDYWLTYDKYSNKGLLNTWVVPPSELVSDEEILKWFEKEFKFYEVVSVEPEKFRENNKVGVAYRRK